MRGLKQSCSTHIISLSGVAPYVGAWIETGDSEDSEDGGQVAPYVGAWIETIRRGKKANSEGVAPYVGAWIETLRPLHLSFP